MNAQLAPSANIHLQDTSAAQAKATIAAVHQALGQRVEQTGLNTTLQIYSGGPYPAKIAYFPQSLEVHHMRPGYNEQTGQIDVKFVNYDCAQYRDGNGPIVEIAYSYPIDAAPGKIVEDIVNFMSERMMKPHADAFLGQKPLRHPEPVPRGAGGGGGG